MNSWVEIGTGPRKFKPGVIWRCRFELRFDPAILNPEPGKFQIWILKLETKPGTRFEIRILVILNPDPARNYNQGRAWLTRQGQTLDRCSYGMSHTYFWDKS